MADNVKKYKNVLYVEPNDMETINGEPLTPDYTDYSIYCNLIVERVSRLKHGYNGENENKTASIMYDMNTGKQGWVSFFRGKSDDYNYLTTDYTNIHFNTVEERNIVEGLQVESIDISYVNRLVPTVVINMVDIRGGGFFGREESTHLNRYISTDNMEKDEDGNAIDNIYSGFMTLPYPRYKLHVKGYYGRDVVYQLTCSKFNARFDNNTGNFNITCEFIGYEYGFLSDLPVKYIVAAPYTSVGREYWNSHVNTPEWQLSNGEKPVLLIDFFKKVKSSLGGTSITSEQIDDYLNISNNWQQIQQEHTSKVSLLNIINDKYNKFLNELKKANSNSQIIVIDDTSNSGAKKNKTIFILNEVNRFQVSNEVKQAYQDLYNALENYRGSGNISSSILTCNGSVDEWGVCNKNILTTTFKYDDKKVLKFVDNKDVNESNIQSHQFSRVLNGKSVILNVETEAKLLKKELDKLKKVPEYCGCICLEGWGVIESNIENLKKELNEYNKRINNGELVSIKNILDISPYIGNFYKIIFCHIETYIYTIFSAVDDIYREIDSGTRIFKNLGISKYNSDVPTSKSQSGVNGEVVPPFPACYKNINGDTATYDGSLPIQKLSWVGEFRGIQPWVEEKLVNEYYNALQMFNGGDNKGFEDIDRVTIDFSMLPFFFQHDINNDLFNYENGLTFYVSLMSYWFLGILNSGDVTPVQAELMGAILAKELFTNTKNVAKLKETLKNPNLNQTIFDSAIKGTTQDEPYSFEFATVENKRQPIFTEEDGMLEYKYMRDTNDLPIIPLGNFNLYSEIGKNYLYNDINNVTKFKPKSYIDGDYILGGDVDETLNGDSVNSNMFSLMLDTCNAQAAGVYYEQYMNNGENIGSYSQLSFKEHILKKYWLMDDNYIKYHRIPVDNFMDKKLNYEEKTSLDDFKLTEEDITEIINRMK